MIDKEKKLSETKEVDEKSDVVNASTIGRTDEVISLEYTESSTNESWVDNYNKFESPHYSENLFSKLSDVKGGFIQKVLFLVGKIFGANIMSLGFIGSMLLKSLEIVTVSPVVSLLVSLLAMFVISVIRRINYFKNRHNEKYKA